MPTTDVDDAVIEGPNMSSCRGISYQPFGGLGHGSFEFCYSEFG
jgi:hypothetical protein